MIIWQYLALAAAMALPLGISGGFSGSSETLSSTMKQESSSLNVKNFLPKKDTKWTEKLSTKEMDAHLFPLHDRYEFNGKMPTSKRKKKKKVWRKTFQLSSASVALCTVLILSRISFGFFLHIPRWPVTFARVVIRKMWDCSSFTRAHTHQCRCDKRKMPCLFSH